MILAVLLLLPRRKVAAHHRDVRAVDGKHMVDDFVQKRTVVADKDEPFFRLQILSQCAARFDIEVVRRLVDEQKAVFADK